MFFLDEGQRWSKCRVRKNEFLTSAYAEFDQANNFYVRISKNYVEFRYCWNYDQNKVLFIYLYYRKLCTYYV